MENQQNAKFLIEKIFEKILSEGNVSIEEKQSVTDALNNELLEKPFRVAIIGQSGVGKSTTLNAVFGLKNYTASIAEGTTNIVEKIFPMRDGFNLSIYDMPGLNNDVDKDLEYEKMYKKSFQDAMLLYMLSMLILVILGKIVAS